MVLVEKFFTVGIFLGALFASAPTQVAQEAAPEKVDNAEQTTTINACTADLNKLRLYPAIFGRNPDPGASSWLMSEESLYGTAQALLESPEFTQNHGHLTDAQFVERLFKEGLGRTSVSDTSITTWTQTIAEEGRAGAATQIAQSAEAANTHRYERSAFCDYANNYGGKDIAAGLTYSKKGDTVVVLVDPAAAKVDTIATPQRATSSTVLNANNLDVVMNANWFDLNTNQTIAPLLSNTQSVGGKDDITKGFIGELTDGSKTSIWHGFVMEPPADTRMGASGIHIVHQGKPGTFDGSYTFTTPKHSALGYTKEGYWILVSTYTNDARSLANLMLDYGAVEAVMLDGGGSTQLAVAGHAGISQTFQRPVTSHVTVESIDQVFAN